jgi:hypothetical protein
MHRGLKTLLVAAVIVVPLFLILFVWAPPPQDPSLLIDPRSPNYPAAVQSLQNTSDLLVTVSMAVLGAIGLLVARLGKSTVTIMVFAAIGFMGSLMSIYFGCRVGFTAALTLAATRVDVMPLLDLLNNQAISALVAGLSLAAIAVLEAFPEKK